MSHQFIFAYPWPDMSELEFQRYWMEIYAVRHASKIPQIRKYFVNTRIALPDDRSDPLWCGAAEIWLENEKGKIEPLQSKKFLQGARLEEPDWAAFWHTVVLDTPTHVLRAGLCADGCNGTVKLIVLSKRKEELPLEGCRSYCLGIRAAKIVGLPGLRRYSQSHMSGTASMRSEKQCLTASKSCGSTVWTMCSVQMHIVYADYRIFAEERYIHGMIVQEHWIIGPEFCQYVGQDTVPAGHKENIPQDNFCYTTFLCAMEIVSKCHPW